MKSGSMMQATGVASLGLLGQTYADAPYCEDMLGLVRQTYDNQFKTIDELSIGSMNAVLDYFGMADSTRFFSSPRLNVTGRSSQRVLEIVRTVGGDLYITGHGAKNYLVVFDTLIEDMPCDLMNPDRPWGERE